MTKPDGSRITGNSEATRSNPASFDSAPDDKSGGESDKVSWWRITT
jgi:hypothetical protein